MSSRAAADHRFALHHQQTVHAVRQLAGSDEVMPLGHRFVDGMAATLAGWQDEVPAPARRAAEEAVREHHRRWLAPAGAR